VRLDIAIVSKTKEEFISALQAMIEQLQLSNTPSNSSMITEDGIDVNFEFTDCNDIYADKSDCLVIFPNDYYDSGMGLPNKHLTTGSKSAILRSWEKYKDDLVGD
jgi:hypothetical protein